LSITHNPVFKEKLEAVKTRANSYVPVPSPLPPQAFIISPSRQKELNRRRNFRRLGLHLTKKRKN
jgi:hypothetical protein